MRIVADLGKCNGYASCIAVAPELFDLNSTGLVEILVSEPSADQRDAAEEAVRACPARAIWLEP